MPTPCSPVAVPPKEIAYDTACAYALAGDKEKALNWLETALRMGVTDFEKIKTDKDLESIRKEPRYETLLYSYMR